MRSREKKAGTTTSSSARDHFVRREVELGQRVEVGRARGSSPPPWRGCVLSATRIGTEM
jgi:hypothetical protein